MAPMIFKYCGRRRLACGMDVDRLGMTDFSLPMVRGYHGHPFFELLLHESGRGQVFSMDGEMLQYQRGVLEIWPPGSLHKRLVESPVELICLYFDARNPIPLPLQTPVRLLNATRFIAELTILMTAPPDRSPRLQEALDYQVSALVFHVLHGIETYNQCGTPDLAPALLAHNLILTQFPHVSSFAEIAHEVGVSYDHLRHLFRKAYGISMKQFLIRTQIDRAKAILIGDPHFPLKHVAQLCGFSSEQHFSMCFRSVMGQPPGRFRQLATHKAMPGALGSCRGSARDSTESPVDALQLCFEDSGDLPPA